jgi:hypothetical protein
MNNMKKNNKKLLGKHMDCKKNGNVWYHSNKSYGYRACDECKQSTIKGYTVFTAKEASLWK